ncbi:MAG: hypothetical protein A2152_00580 [Candidatus Levybacteria bacterium RBG_16_35_6]|nr:MAG: hypothetical protein A2152_00580 [Candidatus Levybacteria bacterium RBG_16_35_6]
MPEVETPNPIPVSATPPVVGSTEKKSNKPVIYAVIALVVILLIVGGYRYLAGSKDKINNQITNLNSTPTQAPSQDLPTNNSNDELDSDVGVIDTQTTNLDSDLNAIDQGFNDQAVNLD